MCAICNIEILTIADKLRQLVCNCNGLNGHRLHTQHDARIVPYVLLVLHIHFMFVRSFPFYSQIFIH